MIKRFVDTFIENQEVLREDFLKKHPKNYKEIVEKVFKLFYKDVADSSIPIPDYSKIHEIDFGDFEGTSIYIIPEKRDPPESFWYVKVSYGTCSGCDTFLGIKEEEYNENDTPTAKQAQGYLTLALHIVQNIKEL